MAEERAIIAGKYRLEKPLAQGGMGSIWVARHLQLDIDVAIKLMAPQYASVADARMRFEREARASAQLRSPHVVHMYDCGAAEDGTLFLAMELLQGEDLDARLRRVGRFAPAEAVSLVDQVCKGLECAHDAGLVHRDLKPANLFMARHGRDEIVKVLDFGIAKATGASMISPGTKTGTLLGSPHYMSPEQVRHSRAVDPRSDLWSMGVIIFQCLTGRVPFAGDELGDVLVAICTDDIPIASGLVPELGAEVDRFLFRALQRNPVHRFQTARELSEAFARILQPSVPSSSFAGPPSGGTIPIVRPGAAAPALPFHAQGPLPAGPASAPVPPVHAISIAQAPPVQAITAPAQAPPLPPSSILVTASSSPAKPARAMGAQVAVIAGACVLGVGLATAFVVLGKRAPDTATGAPEALPAVASALPTAAPPSAAPPASSEVTTGAAPPVQLTASTPPPHASVARPPAPVPPSKAGPSPGRPQDSRRDPLEYR